MVKRGMAVELAMLASLLLFSDVQAHGTGWSHGEAPTAVLSFYYVAGGPMANADVRVFSPEDSASPFQTGRTDRMGRFSFVPDRPGTWTVDASDQEGHKALASVAVGEAGVVEDPTAGITGVLWLSLTANLFLAIASYRYWRARRLSISPAPARASSGGNDAA